MNNQITTLNLYVFNVSVFINFEENVDMMKKKIQQKLN